MGFLGENVGLGAHKNAGESVEISLSFSYFISHICGNDNLVQPHAELLCFSVFKRPTSNKM